MIAFLLLAATCLPVLADDGQGYIYPIADKDRYVLVYSTATSGLVKYRFDTMTGELYRLDVNGKDPSKTVCIKFTGGPSVSVSASRPGRFKLDLNLSWSYVLIMDSDTGEIWSANYKGGELTKLPIP